MLFWRVAPDQPPLEKQSRGTIRPFPVVCQVGGCTILGACKKPGRGQVGRERQRLRREEKYGVRKGGEKGD